MQEVKKEKAGHKMDARSKERERSAQDGMQEVKKEKSGHKIGCKK